MSKNLNNKSKNIHFLNILFKHKVSYRHHELNPNALKYKKLVFFYLKKTHFSISRILYIINHHLKWNLTSTEIVDINLIFIISYLSILGKFNLPGKYQYLEEKNEYIRDETILNSKITNKESLVVLNNLINSFLLTNKFCQKNIQVKEMMYYLLWFSFLFTDYCLFKTNIESLLLKNNNIYDCFRTINYSVGKYIKNLQLLLPKNFNYVVQEVNKVFFR